MSRPFNFKKGLQSSNKSQNMSRYQKKYKRLKWIVKETIFVNAAICDEVVRLEDKVNHVKEERKYLLHRLLQQQNVTDSLKSSSGHAGLLSSNAARPVSQSIAQLLGEIERRRKKTVGKKRSQSDETTVKAEESPMSLILKSSVINRKIRPGQSKKRASSIPLDSNGRPVFPIELGSLTVYSLGDIVPTTGYHTNDAIYPVGYCSTRQYLAINSQTTTCLYTCKVLDDGPAAKFEILPEDAPDVSFVGSTPSSCHQQLLEAINTSRGQTTVPIDPKGSEFFGLTHPTIQNLIQSCAGARKCTNYRWMKFEMSRSEADVYVEEDASVNVSLALSNSTIGETKSYESSDFDIYAKDCPSTLHSLLVDGADDLDMS